MGGRRDAPRTCQGVDRCLCNSRPFSQREQAPSQAVGSDARAVGEPGPRVRACPGALAAFLREASPFQPPQTQSPPLALACTCAPPLAPPAQPCRAALVLRSSRTQCGNPAALCPGLLRFSHSGPAPGPRKARTGGVEGTRQPLPSHPALEASPFRACDSEWRPAQLLSPGPTLIQAARKAWGFQGLCPSAEEITAQRPRCGGGPPTPQGPTGGRALAVWGLALPGEGGQGRR